MKKNLLLKVKHIPAIKPAAQAESTGITTGVIIDRLGYLSASVNLVIGDATGTPDSFSVSAKIQHGSAANGSDMADVTGYTLDALTANNTNITEGFDLTGLKRYMRIVPIVDFTGGTSPAIPLQVSVVLGDADYEPVA